MSAVTEADMLDVAELEHENRMLRERIARLEAEAQSIDPALPDDLRMALEMAHDMAKAGMLFVPMPARNHEEVCELLIRAASALVSIQAATAENTPTWAKT